MRLAFVAVRSLVRWLPLSTAQALGRLLGYAGYAVLRRYRRLTLEHLRFALGPRASEWTCHRVARGVFVNLGQSFLEWLVIDRLSPETLRRRVNVYGLHGLHNALSKGRGVIALTAHFGNWELLATTIASLGFHGGVLARRLRYPEFERFLVQMRARKGVATYARGSLKEAADVLRENQMIGLLPDQDVDSLEGIFVEFFDRPAYTPVGPAALSLMTGAPIVPCFLIRDGRRFRLVIEEPIVVTRTEHRAADLRAITEAWSRVVESYIRRYPDHWVWMHRRWKTQPPIVHSPQSPPQHMADPPSKLADIVHSQTQTSTKSSERTAQRRVPQVALSFFLLTAFCLLLTVSQGCAKQPPSDHPPQATAASTSAQPPEAPQQMDSFTMTGYSPEGVKEWDLEGRGAITEGAVVAIREPRAIGYDLERTSYLTASLAHVNQNTRHIRLEHEVTIHTSDGVWFMAPQMYWLSDRDEMTTEDPVRIETDHMLVRGRGAVAHAQLDTVIIERDIELVANPSDHEPAGQPVSHVTITCDGPLVFEHEKGIAMFHNNVHVQDHQGDLYSDTLIAYVDQNTHTIHYAEAIGRVRIVQGPHTAHGNRAVYEPALAKVTLLGSPYLVLYPDEDTPSPTVSTPPPKELRLSERGGMDESVRADREAKGAPSVRVGGATASQQSPQHIAATVP